MDGITFSKIKMFALMEKKGTLIDKCSTKGYFLLLFLYFEIKDPRTKIISTNLTDSLISPKWQV